MKHVSSVSAFLENGACAPMSHSRQFHMPPPLFGCAPAAMAMKVARLRLSMRWCWFRLVLTRKQRAVQLVNARMCLHVSDTNRHCPNTRYMSAIGTNRLSDSCARLNMALIVASSASSLSAVSRRIMVSSMNSFPRMMM